MGPGGEADGAEVASGGGRRVLALSLLASSSSLSSSPSALAANAHAKRSSPKPHTPSARTQPTQEQKSKREEESETLASSAQGGGGGSNNENDLSCVYRGVDQGASVEHVRAILASGPRTRRAKQQWLSAVLEHKGGANGDETPLQAALRRDDGHTGGLGL
jgi:hypothetical protein